MRVLQLSRREWARLLGVDAAEVAVDEQHQHAICHRQQRQLHIVRLLDAQREPQQDRGDDAARVSEDQLVILDAHHREEQDQHIAEDHQTRRRGANHQLMSVFAN